MKNIIKDEITRFIRESRLNYSSEIAGNYFEEPLVGFADPAVLLFEEYKSVVTEQHLTPSEAFEMKYGQGSFSRGTVISVVLPVSEKVRKSNSRQKDHSSKEWAMLRTYGDDIFIDELKMHITDFLIQKGFRTVAPSLLEGFKIERLPAGPVSNWSERHIAYAAGLGTFSINDGFISERGIAIRLASFVTELELVPDTGILQHYGANCLFMSKGSCGACFKRCPVGALSEKGHDKQLCYKQCYGEGSHARAKAYGIDTTRGSGCGLCQTGVPCEFRNPRAIK